MIRALDRAIGPAHQAEHRRVILAVALAALLQGVCFALTVPVLDHLLSGAPETAWPWIGAMLFVGCVQMAVRWYAQDRAFRFGRRVASILHRRLGDHIVRLPLGWFVGGRSGEVSLLTSQGVPQLMSVPAHLLRPILEAVLIPAAAVVVLVVYEWRLALVVLVTAPLVAIVYHWSGNVVQRFDRSRHDASTEASARIVEYAQAQPVLRAFRSQEAGPGFLDDALGGERQAVRRALLGSLPGLVGYSTVVRFAYVVLMVTAVSLALDDALRPSLMLALVLLGVRMVEPVSAAGDLGAALRMAQNYLDRVNDVLTASVLPEPSRAAPIADSSIEFEQVEFRYDEASEPVVQDISFRVPAGTSTALVGPSGSGKTTIARLVARFWDVHSGAVRVGGVDVRDLPSQQLMSQLAIVFQDVYLFEGTLTENILMGAPARHDDSLREAAHGAGLVSMIEALPQGWDTRVGEGGATLSGGQKQRVSIARALYKGAPVMILDEATAALDPETETLIEKTVRAQSGRRTLLIIAHRLGTLEAADQILFLERGRIVERGTHEELLQLGGRYADFWRVRARASGWRLAPM